MRDHSCLAHPPVDGALQVSVKLTLMVRAAIAAQAMLALHLGVAQIVAIEDLVDVVLGQSHPAGLALSSVAVGGPDRVIGDLVGKAPSRQKAQRATSGAVVIERLSALGQEPGSTLRLL